MYLSFYGLQKKPFQVSSDPSFLWLGEKHNEALATLKYANFGNQGFILLTGDVGTGKTTLINALINSLGEEVIVAKVPDPGMEIIDFMNYISHAFGIKKKFSSKDGFLIHFDHFLNSAHVAGKKILLIIDEAQRLSPALLEEIRQLSNIETQETKLLSIFFVGQSEFRDVLLEYKNRALRQRITLNYVIEPLDVHETGEFIRHRLKIAGAEGEIFSPDAIRNVYEFSGGFPRRINIICDHSLLLGFGEDAKTITGNIVKECAKDLLLSESTKNKDNVFLQSLDAADSDKLETIPSESTPEMSSRKNWKIFIMTVVLIALAVAIATFLKNPGEKLGLFFHNNNKEVQSFSGEHGATTSSVNRYPEPDMNVVSIKGAGKSSDTRVPDEGTHKVVTAEKPPVAEVKPVSAVLTGERPDIPQEKPVVPDLLHKGAEIPEDGKDRIVTGSFHSAQADSPSDLNQKDPTNEQETQKTPVIPETDKVVNKAPANLDAGALIDLVIKKRSK